LTLISQIAATEAPPVYTIHPKAVDRYRSMIDDLHSALKTDDALNARNAVRGLLDHVVFLPGQGKGEFELEIHGRLAALLSTQKPTNPEVIGKGRLMVGAGIGFEPMTFRL
jgi:hypothetical protein